jgi:hypothetical protein
MNDLETRPVPVGRVKSDPDDSHLYCCSEDVSLCGLDISDADDLDFSDDECCPRCLSLQESPCGPGCRDFATKNAYVITSWIPPYEAARRLGIPAQRMSELDDLIKAGRLHRARICDDHDSIDEASVMALLNASDFTAQQGEVVAESTNRPSWKPWSSADDPEARDQQADYDDTPNEEGDEN